MKKGSFSVRKSTQHTSLHNSRKVRPRYLIGFESGEKNEHKVFQNEKTFIARAKKLYRDKVGQKMQKKNEENLIHEAVINMTQNHTFEDIQKLMQHLQKKYGGHEILEISIHRDEGHLERNGISYQPTKNILFVKNEEWFFEDWYLPAEGFEAKKVADFTKKVDITEFQKIYNYHAHVKFSMFDTKRGKMARMGKKEMSFRIKEVSDFMGLDYAPGADRKKQKTVHQIKDEHAVKSKQNIENAEIVKRSKKRQKEMLDVLKKENAELRAALQARGAKREDYAELESVVSSLKERIKEKDLSIEDMREALKSHKENFQKIENQKTLLQKEILLLRKEISRLRFSLEGDIETLKTMNLLAHNNLKKVRTENRNLKEENQKIYQILKNIGLYLKKPIQTLMRTFSIAPQRESDEEWIDSFRMMTKEWLFEQREAYRNDTLPDWKISELNRVRPNWDVGLHGNQLNKKKDDDIDNNIGNIVDEDWGMSP